jgi:hypothetical protein
LSWPTLAAEKALGGCLDALRLPRSAARHVSQTRAGWQPAGAAAEPVARAGSSATGQRVPKSGLSRVIAQRSEVPVLVPGASRCGSCGSPWLMRGSVCSARLSACGPGVAAGVPRAAGRLTSGAPLPGSGEATSMGVPSPQKKTAGRPGSERPLLFHARPRGEPACERDRRCAHEGALPRNPECAPPHLLV